MSDLFLNISLFLSIHGIAPESNSLYTWFKMKSNCLGQQEGGKHQQGLMRMEYE